MLRQLNRNYIDPFDNLLFEVCPEEIAFEDIPAMYAEHKCAANPEAVPEKAGFRNGFFAHHSNQYLSEFDYQAPKYKDGFLETKTSYLDIFGAPIIFTPDAEDNLFFALSTEFDNRITFSGNKFFNWGWIQLTDCHKSGCYRALFDPQSNAIYTLPDGFEMSRLDYNAEAVLYRMGAEGIPEVAYKIALKTYPSIMMYAHNVLYPWEDDKVYSDICPIEKDGKILIPFEAVFAHFFADVSWNVKTKTAIAVKGTHQFCMTAGSCSVLIDGEEYHMENHTAVIHDRLMVPLEAVTAFFAITAQWIPAKRCIRFIKERPYWEKWGKVENSYTTIPLSSKDPYPPYLQKEAEQTVSDILSIDGAALAHMAFMTDIHYTPCENDHIRLERTLNTYRDIARKIPLDGMALGGDRIFEACKEIRTKGLQEYRSHFRDIPYFPVNGNHDPGGQWDNYVIQSTNSANCYTKQDLYNEFYNHLPNQNVVFNPDDPNNQLYYYKDDPARKLRCIFLDSSDIPQTEDENGKMIYNPIGYLAFSQKQIDWVANHALNMPGDDWTVLVFVHHVIDPEQAADYEMTIQKNRHTQVMVKLLDAYNTGENMDETLYIEHSDFMLRLKYDFSKYHRAAIAGVIMGHTHSDYAKYSLTGIPYIHTASAYADDITERTIAPDRYDGTKEEILYDIITVCNENKTLHLTRVGAGDNRVFKYT